MATDGYNRLAFGASWLFISVLLEIWWLVAVITSAVIAQEDEHQKECGWTSVTDGDWFSLLILILIFFGQFSIGELIGMIEYHKAKNLSIAWMPKWMIVSLQVVSGLYLCVNVLAVAQNGTEETEHCMTGQIMMTTVVVNTGYMVVTFVFSFITLPLADVNAPDNQHKVELVPQKDADEEEEEEVAEQEDVDAEKKSLVVDIEQKQSGDQLQPNANTDAQTAEQTES